MSITLEKVAEKYLVAKSLSDGTRKEYRSTVTKWVEWGQGVAVDQIERHRNRADALMPLPSVDAIQSIESGLSKVLRPLGMRMRDTSSRRTSPFD